MITHHKTLIKKLSGSTSRKSDEREKKEKNKQTRVAIAKLFALNANAKNAKIKLFATTCLVMGTNELACWSSNKKKEKKKKTINKYWELPS